VKPLYWFAALVLVISYGLIAAIAVAARRAEEEAERSQLEREAGEVTVAAPGIALADGGLIKLKRALPVFNPICALDWISVLSQIKFRGA